MNPPPTPTPKKSHRFTRDFLGYKNSAVWQNAFYVNLFYFFYVKRFECIVPLQHSGYYIVQDVQRIILNILLLRPSYRIYVTLSETEGLSW